MNINKNRGVGAAGFVGALLASSVSGAFAFAATYIAGGFVLIAIGINTFDAKPLPWPDYILVVPMALLAGTFIGLHSVDTLGWALIGLVLLTMIATGTRSRVVYALGGGFAGLGIVLIRYLSLGVHSVPDFWGCLLAAGVGGVVFGITSWWILSRALR